MCQKKATNIEYWNSSVALTTEFVQNLDKKGLLKRNFDRPPIKDTYSMPTQGYAIVRFIADNPGFWLLHCHIESHSDSGMVLMFKVGESKDLPTKPNKWPTCGPYQSKDENAQTSSEYWSLLNYVLENVRNFLNSFKF